MTAPHAWRTDDAPEDAPSNLEAEQALLGALLFENETFHLLDGLAPEHFFEPIHGAMFGAIASHARRGVLADPATLKTELERHSAFKDLGGFRYLVDLVDQAPPATSAPAYARVIIEAHQRRQLIKLSSEMGYTLRREPDVAVAEVIQRVDASLMALQVDAHETKPESAASAAARVIERLESPEKAQQGVLTGLAPLDAITGPWLPDDLILLMGRPSMGKSALAGCIALNVAAPWLLDENWEPDFDGRELVGVMEFNGEMTEEQMVRRHLTDICFRRWGRKAPVYSAIRKREVTPEQVDMLRWAAGQLRRVPLVMRKRSRITLSQLRSAARRQKADWARQGIRLGMLQMDHAGHVRPDERVKDLREANTIVSAGLKELADELKCPVVALNQMSRQSEKRFGAEKRPQLDDIRESGSWEQDADFVIGCYREAYYAQREPEPKGGVTSDDWHDWDRRRKSKTVEAIVLKAREGEIATAELWASIGHNAIRGASPDHGDLI